MKADKLGWNDRRRYKVGDTVIIDERDASREGIVERVMPSGGLVVSVNGEQIRFNAQGKAKRENPEAPGRFLIVSLRAVA